MGLLDRLRSKRQPSPGGPQPGSDRAAIEAEIAEILSDVCLHLGDNPALTAAWTEAFGEVSGHPATSSTFIEWQRALFCTSCLLGGLAENPEMMEHALPELRHHQDRAGIAGLQLFEAVRSRFPAHWHRLCETLERDGHPVSAETRGAADEALLHLRPPSRSPGDAVAVGNLYVVANGEALAAVESILSNLYSSWDAREPMGAWPGRRDRRPLGSPGPMSGPMLDLHAKLVAHGHLGGWVGVQGMGDLNRFMPQSL